MTAARLRAAVVAGAVALLPAVALAQQSGTSSPPAAEPSVHNLPFVLGAVLKIVARSLGSDPVVGRVDSLRGEWVVLDTVAPRLDGGLFEANIVPVDQFRYVAVRAQDLRSVEVREGVSRASGVLRFGLIGLAVGGVVGGLSNGQGVSDSGGGFGPGFLVGGAAGAIIGGTLGYLSGHDLWRKVEGPYYLNAPR